MLPFTKGAARCVELTTNRGAMFSYVSLEERVPPDHRTIRRMTDRALERMYVVGVAADNGYDTRDRRAHDTARGLHDQSTETEARTRLRLDGND